MHISTLNSLEFNHFGLCYHVLSAIARYYFHTQISHSASFYSRLQCMLFHSMCHTMLSFFQCLIRGVRASVKKSEILVIWNAWKDVLFNALKVWNGVLWRAIKVWNQIKIWILISLLIQRNIWCVLQTMGFYLVEFLEVVDGRWHVEIVRELIGQMCDEHSELGPPISKMVDLQDIMAWWNGVGNKLLVIQGLIYDNIMALHPVLWITINPF